MKVRGISKLYSVDFDFPKMLLDHHITKIWWRLSPSKKGFHFCWYCPKRSCAMCKDIKLWLDDETRLQMDANRRSYSRNVLWDKKGNKHAGKWKEVTI